MQGLECRRYKMKNPLKKFDCYFDFSQFVFGVSSGAIQYSLYFGFFVLAFDKYERVTESILSQEEIDGLLDAMDGAIKKKGNEKENQ